MDIVKALSGINYTFLFAIITISLTAMATLIKIFSKKIPLDQLPGTSFHCIQQNKDIKIIEDKTIENNRKNEELKNIISEMQTEVAVLSTESRNNTKTIDEIKDNIKGVSLKMDDLLKQILAWIE